MTTQINPIAVPDVPLCRPELDKMSRCIKCSRTDCHNSHVCLHALCHPQVGLEITYQRATGCFVLTCKTCGGYVARVQVAWAVPS